MTRMNNWKKRNTVPKVRYSIAPAYIRRAPDDNDAYSAVQIFRYPRGAPNAATRPIGYSAMVCRITSATRVVDDDECQPFPSRSLSGSSESVLLGGVSGSCFLLDLKPSLNADGSCVNIRNNQAKRGRVVKNSINSQMEKVLR